MSSLFLVLLCLGTGTIGADNGCAVYPFEVNPHPLIIPSKSSDFIYPKWGENVLRFETGELVDIICPGRDIIINSSRIQSSLVKATCVGGAIFEINNIEVQWKQLRCNGYPWRTIKYTGNTCAHRGREIETGFKITENRFLRTLLICFNQELQIAHYTFVNLTTSINQRALRNPRPSWLQGPMFYTIGRVTKLYLRSKQRTTINELLGLPRNSTKYIRDATNYFLAKGHLTARSDTFYAVQQNATFFVQNAAPQWQTFNGFNWNKVEIGIRDYAEANGVNLQVWTGVHGISMLPHAETGEDVELYLFVNKTSKALPVPEVFWKAVFNPITEQGVAIIGINNPYISTFTPICVDVSNDFSWLDWKKTNQKMGFCYACSIPNFRKVVTVLPYFKVKGLLLL